MFLYFVKLQECLFQNGFFFVVFTMIGELNKFNNLKKLIPPEAQIRNSERTKHGGVLLEVRV